MQFRHEPEHFFASPRRRGAFIAARAEENCITSQSIVFLCDDVANCINCTDTPRGSVVRKTAVRI